MMSELSDNILPQTDFTKTFQQLFLAYTENPSEAILNDIADMGRELVKNSVPPENIGEMYEVCLSGLANRFPDLTISENTERLSTPLVELLIAYGLSFREFIDNRTRYESTRLTSIIIEHSLDGIWMADDQGNILTANPSFVRITGYDIAESIGNNIAVLQGFSQEDAIMATIWEMTGRNGFWKGEIASRRKNGEIYPALMSISVVRDSNGKINNYIGVLNDITEKNREENIKQELERARQIYNLIVQPQLPEISGIEIHAKCIPAEKIGGDIMEIIKIDSRRIMIFLADITGHGVSAAMTANTLKTLFKEIAEKTSEPAKVFNYLNNVMYKNILPDDMIAAFCGLIDLETMNIVYCLNGLPQPFIKRNDEIIRLKPTGYPLGVFERIQNTETTIPIEYGDLFLVFTDGITEIKSPTGDISGIDIVIRSVTNKDSDVNTTVEQVIRDAEQFLQKKSFADDIIVLAVSFYNEMLGTQEICRSNTYSFPTKSVCKGKTKFLFIDEVVAFFVNYVAEKTGETPEDLGWMKISLFEMVLNAIEHGSLEMTDYKNNPSFYDSEEYWKIFNERMQSETYGDRRINIECRIMEEGVELIVEDDGLGFDTKLIQQKSKTMDLFNPTGRGIALAKLNVNKLTYNSRGNRVSLLKKIN